MGDEGGRVISHANIHMLPRRTAHGYICIGDEGGGDHLPCEYTPTSAQQKYPQICQKAGSSPEMIHPGGIFVGISWGGASYLPTPKEGLM